MSLTKEQLKCISTIDNSLVVSASAGTGKTFTMVERIKNLIINNNVSLDNILVLAFNNSIASENKQKISKALIDILINQEEKDIEKIKFIKNELEKINLGNISTVDAFSQKIFKEFSYIIDFPDDLNLISEEKSEKLLIEIIDKTIKDFARENKEEYRHILLSSSNDKDLLISNFFTIINFARSTDNIEDTIKNIVLNETDYENLSNNLKTYIYNFYLNRFKKLNNLVLNNLDDILDEITEKIPSDFKNLVYLIRDLLNNSTSYINLNNKLEKILEDHPINITQKRSRKETKDIRDIYKKEIETFREILNLINEKDSYYQDSYKEYLEIISKVSLKIFNRFQNYKKQKKYFDFKDATYYANMILESTSEEASKVLKSINFVFVDEYQDISPIQERLIRNISNSAKSSNKIDQIREDVANTFVVGDIKQAINGFRGTSSKEFLRRISLAKEDKNKNGELIKFNSNFRSSKEILNFVNDTMIDLMDENFGEINYQDEKFIVDDTVFSDNNSEIQIAELSKTEKKLDYNKLIFDISSKIKDILEEKPELDNKEKKEKYKLKDIAVLFRNLTQKDLDQISKNFKDNNIAFNIRKDTSDTFSKKFKLISYIFDIIHYPDNNYPLFFLLTSDVFNFSYEDIGELRKIDKYKTLYDNLNAYLEIKNDNLSKKIEKTLNSFEKLRVYSSIHTVSQLLKYLLANKEDLFDKDQFSIDLLEKDLLMLIPQLEDLDCNNSLIEFINEQENIKVSKNLDNYKRDSITITTVHQSKGLDWPIVFVVDNSNSNHFKDPILTDYDFGIHFKNIDYKTKLINESLLYKLVGVIKDKKEAEEELRLFYVALTRAKYRNYIFYSTTSDNLFKFLLPDNFSNLISTVNIIKKYSGDRYLDNYPFRLKLKDELKEEIKIEIEESPYYEEKIKETDGIFESKLMLDTSPIATSVTEINKSLKEDVKVIKFNSHSSNKDLGIIYHKILELIDFKKVKAFLGKDNEAELIEEEIKNIINLYIDKENKEDIDIEKLIEVFFEEDFYDIILKSKNFYKELSFIMVDDRKNVYKELNVLSENINSKQIQIKGKIDLLIVDKDDNYYLIDYKLSSHQEDILINDYKYQLLLYKKSLEDNNKKVKKIYLLDINQAKLIEL